MPAIAFDTLKFANKLKEAGVPEKQAEAQAFTMAEALQVNLDVLATKEQVNRLGVDLQNQIGQVRTDLTKEIEQVRADLTKEIQIVRQEVGNTKNELIQMMKQSETRQDGQNLLFKWMFSAVVGLCIAILGRLLFFKVG